GIADATQGFLVRWASDAVTLLSRTTTWVHAGSLPGTFFVDHAGRSVEVVVAQACSGADSLLGAAILLPLLLTIWKGPAVRRSALAALALAGALVLNWLRLLILVAAVHFLGGNVTFEVIHPFLGFALFALLGLILSALTRPLGLYPSSLPPSLPLVLPGKRRTAVAGALAAGLFTMLWPLFTTPLGNAGNPLSVPYTELSRLIPPLPGFVRSVAYQADESSILGPHSATLAFLYRTASGANALAEVWSTPNPAALASYGFRDCLLYHGDQIIATQSFSLPSGLPAVAYAVAMAPATVGGTRPVYVDVEWNSVVKTPEGLRYLRWSVAAFPQSPTLWPPSIRLASPARALSGLQRLSVPPSDGKWPAYLEATKTLLQQFSGSIYASLTAKDGSAAVPVG
ncbi:MAG: exosortase/archaeosortase family protein, partial [Firmicutes bacterium]|nr:exosortase/archaeosortase family protein [Bacillota bacterium]